MATHPSTEKRLRQNLQLRDRNRRLRSLLRSTLKSVRSAVESEGSGDVAGEVTRAQSLIDRMVSKGVIHRNTAARYKSRLSQSAAGRQGTAA